MEMIRRKATGDPVYFEPDYVRVRPVPSGTAAWMRAVAFDAWATVDEVFIHGLRGTPEVGHYLVRSQAELSAHSWPDGLPARVGDFMIEQFYRVGIHGLVRMALVKPQDVNVSLTVRMPEQSTPRWSVGVLHSDGKSGHGWVRALLEAGEPEGYEELDNHAGPPRVEAARVCSAWLTAMSVNILAHATGATRRVAMPPDTGRLLGELASLSPGARAVIEQSMQLFDQLAPHGLAPLPGQAQPISIHDYIQAVAASGSRER